MHFERMCSKFVVNFVIIILLSLPFCVAGHGLLCNEFEFHLKKKIASEIHDERSFMSGVGLCTATQRHKRKSGIPFHFPLEILLIKSGRHSHLACVGAPHAMNLECGRCIEPFAMADKSN